MSCLQFSEAIILDAFNAGISDVGAVAIENFGEELTAIEALAIGAFFETNPIVASNYTIFRFAAFMTDLKARRNSLPPDQAVKPRN